MRTSKKALIAVCLGIALLLLVGALVLNKASQHSDAERFSVAQEKAAYITTSLLSYLDGNAKPAKQKNVCFNTGQGPYGNGYLWCQSATVIELQNGIGYEMVGSEFLKIGKTIGKPYADQDKTFPRYWITLDNGVVCHLDMQDSTGRHYGGARRNPLAGLNDSSTAVAVSCGDRAKARHYEYVD